MVDNFIPNLIRGTGSSQRIEELLASKFLPRSIGFDDKDFSFGHYGQLYNNFKFCTLHLIFYDSTPKTPFLLIQYDRLPRVSAGLSRLKMNYEFGITNYDFSFLWNLAIADAGKKRCSSFWNIAYPVHLFNFKNSF